MRLAWLVHVRLTLGPLFSLFPEYWLEEKFLDEGLHIIVETHEAGAKQEAHVAAYIGDEAVCVIDDVLLPLLIRPLRDDNFESEIAVSAVENELLTCCKIELLSYVHIIL